MTPCIEPLLEPMDAVFLSILIEQQKEISPLREVLSADGRTIISNASKEHLQGALILIPSITTPLINNKLTLRSWQQLVFVELDVVYRERKLIIEIIGEWIC